MENVEDLSKKIWQGLKEMDSTALKEYIHSEPIFVHMGVTLTRDEEIEVIKSERIIYKDVVFEEHTIHPFDSVIVLLNKVKLTAIVGGEEVINPFVVTEVYTENKDKLELISFSYTRINY
ncbi:nuclear transport factor 2 family protein [Enterococcus termitis]|uniref:DUF4440 domain-containing protein n=1 Tax=Enterococcus termitis TaxID=332950 RepID=A0A1E5GI15_9ENTE|nr:nuclear transport factor 2 family protein [Enterococcus termitis]OEG12307.1 hypothetical protein BCR25_07125 [Enterococcus termitis]OJG98873.1 hypothetical protein RV18_GL002735 [Enterococcus termitis]